MADSTVIEKLVIELGLDPKKLTQGQRAAIDGLKQFKDSARKEGKEVEEASARTANAIGKVKGEVLSFFSAVFAARGIKEFVSNITQADAALGRLAPQLGSSTQQLSKWRNAANIAGASAEEITGAIGGLVRGIQNFAITGDSTLIPWANALQLKFKFLKDGTVDYEDALFQLSDKLRAMGSPSKAAAFGSQFGLTPDLVSFMLGDVRKMVSEVERLGVVTKEQADKAQEMQSAWRGMQTAAESFGRVLVSDVSPAMTTILGKARDFFAGINPGSGGLLEKSRSSFWQLLGGVGLGSSPGINTGTPQAGPASGLRLKPGAAGAGSSSLGTLALADALQREIPGLSRFTALNDAYHAGSDSQHAKGLALDFTLNDPATSKSVAARIRKELAARGVNGLVKDEYTDPSPGSTGGHIHVGFAGAGDAQRYYDAAGAAAVSNISNASSSSTATTSIGTIIVNTRATDAQGVAAALRPAIESHSIAVHAQQGPN